MEKKYKDVHQHFFFKLFLECRCGDHKTEVTDMGVTIEEVLWKYHLKNVPQKPAFLVEAENVAAEAWKR